MPFASLFKGSGEIFPLSHCDRFVSRDLETSSTDFVSVSPDKVFDTTPHKLQLLCQVGTGGGGDKMKVLLTWFVGKSLLKHQCNVQIVRIENRDTALWKVWAVLGKV